MNNKQCLKLAGIEMYRDKHETLERITGLIRNKINITNSDIFL